MRCEHTTYERKTIIYEYKRELSTHSSNHRTTDRAEISLTRDDNIDDGPVEWTFPKSDHVFNIFGATDWPRTSANGVYLFVFCILFFSFSVVVSYVL